MSINDNNVTLEKLIISIQKTLNEIKNEQTITQNIIEKNHKINMQRFSRLENYNKINDMTNKIFERRISNIENLLYEVLQSKRCAKGE